MQEITTATKLMLVGSGLTFIMYTSVDFNEYPLVAVSLGSISATMAGLAALLAYLNK